MLYMVEMDLPDRSRIAAWHAWYDEHINKLLTLDGYAGAQRFEAMTPCPSPFLAIHEVTGADFFESTQYRAVGGPAGTGEWQALMTNWHRNLFDGCASLPEVARDQRLVVVEDGVTPPVALAERVTWLSNAGLDGSILRRGIVVCDAGDGAAEPDGTKGLNIFRPITQKFA